MYDDVGMSFIGEADQKKHLKKIENLAYCVGGLLGDLSDSSIRALIDKTTFCHIGDLERELLLLSKIFYAKEYALFKYKEKEDGQ